MAAPGRIVLFTLDGQPYGVPLATVERVVRMVEVTAMPGAPEFVRGVINVQGRIVPVIDLRRRFGFATRPPELCDQLVIFGGSHTGGGFAIMVDGTGGVRECREKEVAEVGEILPGLPFLAGVAKFADGIVLISEPNLLLTPGDCGFLHPEAERPAP